MVFNTLEELKASVESRRASVLTIEIDMGAAYSPEHEDAKKKLALAEGMQALSGGQGFLADNLASLKQRVADTRPEHSSVWAQYRRIPLDEWALLIKTQGLTAEDQYERVLPKTFIAVYGQDPVDDDGNPVEGVEPLSTDASLMSSRSPNTILPGGGLSSVVTAFMAWQNSGGDVTIRPTRSGRV